MKQMISTEYRSSQEKIISILCDSYNCVLEADTMEDLLGGAVRRWPIPDMPEVADVWSRLLEMEKRIQDYVRSDKIHNCDAETVGILEDYLALYFDVLRGLVYKIAGKQKDYGKSVQLELMMRWKCCMLNMENRLLLPPCHPVELIVNVLEGKLQEKAAGNLADAVLKIMEQSHNRYKIALSDQIFLRVPRGSEQKFGEALPLQKAGSLTSISSIRFIEKAAHFMETHGKNKVRMACVGEVQEAERVEKFYKRKNSQVQLFVLKRLMAEDGRLLFRIEDPQGRLDANDKKVFNLLLLSDLQALFRQFDVVLFMDEGCFYSTGQADKTIEERFILSHLQWTHAKAEGEKKLEKKLFWYLEEFDAIGRWLNGLNMDATASLQFNEKLFGAIRNAAVPECDVYLYISQGRYVGDFDLYRRNICNDENYGGKSVAVYKVPSARQASDEETKNIQRLTKGKSEEILIDAWKLVKSISEEYQEIFLKKFEKADDMEAVDILKKAFLSIRIHRQEQGIEIVWNLRKKSGAGEQDKTREIEAFLRELLQEGFQETASSCIAVYLRRIVGNAVVARGNSVQDVLLGYLLKAGHFNGYVRWQEGTEQISGTALGGTLSDGLFTARRTVYSVIKNLNGYQLRDYDRREEFLLYEFKDKYCPEISRDVYTELIEEIHEACGRLGYEDSSLFAYSSIRGGKMK